MVAPLVPGGDENLASKVRFLSQNDLLCLVNMITSRSSRDSRPYLAILANREETLESRGPLQRKNFHLRTSTKLI